MKLSDKYCRESDNTSNGNEKKKVISNDSFAICEFLESLTKHINRLVNK